MRDIVVGSKRGRVRRSGTRRRVYQSVSSDTMCFPMLFCFNFLEATGSPFRSPTLLFSRSFFFSLHSLQRVPLSSVTARHPSWELREMYHGGFQHCVDAARYISSSSSLFFLPALLCVGFPPASHTIPTAPCLSIPVSLALSFSAFPPTRLSLLRNAFSHAATPLPRSKGLNRPVQFPTRSATNPRS